MNPRLSLQRAMLSVFAFGILSASPVHAATFDLSAAQVGGVFEDGTADNLPTFQNYYVGYSTLTSTSVRRTFFHFDLSGVTTPIIAADFSLILPDGGLIFGGGNTIEEFVLSGTTVPIPTLLDPGITAGDGMAAWATFGDPLGLIGGVTFDSSVPIIIPPEGLEIVIPLSPLGVDLINANLGGELLITGRMLDVTPLDPMGEMSELIFGLSDVVSGDPAGPTGLTVPFLSLTEIPEPQAALFASLALVFLLGQGRRRR